MTPTIKYAMPSKEYHAGPWVHSHDLVKLLQKAPASFRYGKEHPEPPTDAMRLGTAFHTLMLEPLKFGEENIVQPADIPDRRTKAWKEFEAAHSDKFILRQQEYADLCGMKASFDANPDIVPIISDSQHEVSMFWTDEETGIDLCARLDCLRHWKAEGVAVIDDAKTAGDASPEEFSKECYNRGYDLQAAVYIEAAKRCLGVDKVRYGFNVVEKDAPYLSVHYDAPDEMLAIGYAKFRHALKLYAECAASKTWAGYQGGLLPQPPVWEMKKWGV